LPDPHRLWELALSEIAIEGSDGCNLKRLWDLVGLRPTQQPESKSAVLGGVSGMEKDELAERSGLDNPSRDLRRWLWRTLVSRRCQEIDLATYS
ncbi:unnamed protein product, partial [Choristocarpus tenellus]